MYRLLTDIKCMAAGRVNAPLYSDRVCSSPCCAQLRVPSCSIMSAASPAPDGLWRDPPATEARSFADNLMIPGAWLLQDQIQYFEVRSFDHASLIMLSFLQFLEDFPEARVPALQTRALSGGGVSRAG